MSDQTLNKEQFKLLNENQIYSPLLTEFYRSRPFMDQRVDTHLSSGKQILLNPIIYVYVTLLT